MSIIACTRSKDEQAPAYDVMGHACASTRTLLGAPDALCPVLNIVLCEADIEGSLPKRPVWSAETERPQQMGVAADRIPSDTMPVVALGSG